jgi:hypothetical protein
MVNTLARSHPSSHYPEIIDRRRAGSAGLHAAQPGVRILACDCYETIAIVACHMAGSLNKLRWR